MSTQSVGRKRAARSTATTSETKMLRPELTETFSRLFAALRRTVSRRTPRARLALIGLPLAMVASLLTQPLCAIPLLVCAWWWTPRVYGWEWTTVCGRAVLGTEWALVGAGALAAFPNATVFVGFCWIAAAALIGAAAWLLHRLS